MVWIREIGRFALGTVWSFLLGLGIAIILATFQLLGENPSSNEEL